MKIALVILHADASRGGAERYTLDLSDSLVKRGHHVSLLASSFVDVPAGVLTVAMPATGSSRAGQYHRFLNAVELHTASEKYDIVHAMLPIRHCDVYHPHAGVAVESLRHGHLKKATRIQRALSGLGNRFNLRRRQFAAVERGLLTTEYPPSVLCLSEQIKSTVVRHYPNLAGEKLVTLFNGTDLTRFDPSALPDPRETTRQRFALAGDDVVGLMIAQDFERKGLGQCIHAVSKISSARLKLLVVGREDATVYRNLAGELGVTDRVRFAGPTDDPAAFYRAADFFVLPTRSDPCSLVVLEALAMGLPVISTKANGACEIMTDGIHGRILGNPDNILCLVAAMVQLMDPESRRTMTGHCLSLRQRLSVEHHLDALEKVYQQVGEHLTAG